MAPPDAIDPERSYARPKSRTAATDLILANALCCRGLPWLGQRMQFDQLKRREFITLLGGAAVAWPLAARAQQASACGASACSCTRPRTIPKRRPASRRFCRGCSNWAGPLAATCGSTSLGRGRCRTAIAVRGGIGRARAGRHPGRLARRPCRHCKQATRTVPIVFTTVPDPVGAGFVDSLARPGGNTTGFTSFEYGISGKWLELLKQIAPSVTRAGGPSGSRDCCRRRPVSASIQSVAPVARGGAAFG